MEKRTTGYWLATGAIVFFMFFSAGYSGTHAAEFARLGFPEYFRIELTLGKIVGALLLLVPQVPGRVRDWIYAAFTVNLVSAAIAKYNSGYTLLQSLEPAVVLIIMSFLIWYLDSLKRPAAVADRAV